MHKHIHVHIKQHRDKLTNNITNKMNILTDQETETADRQMNDLTDKRVAEWSNKMTDRCMALQPGRQMNNTTCQTMYVYGSTKADRNMQGIT